MNNENLLLDIRLQGKKDNIERFINKLELDNPDCEVTCTSELNQDLPEGFLRVNAKFKHKEYVKPKEQVDSLLWKEIGKQEGKMKWTKDRILREFLLATGSEPSDEIREIIKYIHEIETLDGIRDELWGIRDIDKIEAVIKKYKK